MEVDNVVEGSLMYMCVCVWVCVCVCVCMSVRESLPPASNIAVLFCPAAPELISYRLLCCLCCWYVPVSALDWRKRFTYCCYFSWVSPVIPETDVPLQHFTTKRVNRRISVFPWNESMSKWVDSLSKKYGLLWSTAGTLLILSQAQVSCLREFLAPQEMTCLLRGVCCSQHTDQLVFLKENLK